MVFQEIQEVRLQAYFGKEGATTGVSDHLDTSTSQLQHIIRISTTPHQDAAQAKFHVVQRYIHI
jgi:hypothetical protein